ncbi:large conductance mechanosensitive channel protein MscL [Luteolibacter yonseiensis]|uniref:Large-conductance mechanosensitive channel n=1 Tax=Luteolibacter yonseiensis TaxID=1144680 RepID=A0A934R4K8_9BACT|nr:large conductance mechanosensitive channel protein MscL [Luteolibacter yonseiensis]MBK1816809.1 large conductance mechanosensitive channel protein MscL [Luteolibacter yonseiensis]
MLIQDFKAFAFKGNLIDMAVGIIIGGAFGTVVKSLVDNVFMPPLGILTGRVNFSAKFISLDNKPYDSLTKAKEAGAPVIAYGQFITDLISFVILAFAVFIVTKKVIGALRTHHETAAAAPALTTDQKLLTEIRDCLKAGHPGNGTTGDTATLS